MINRHIIATGMPRTGTFGMSELFKRLIGEENAHHEQGGIVNKEYHVQAYDLDKSPDRFLKHIDRIKKSIDIDKPYFNANWRWAIGIYLLEKYIPSLRFFILIRDPVDCASSWKHKRWLAYKKNDWTYQEFCSKVSDEVFVDTYIRLYEFIIVQIKKMVHKPFVVDFDCYIQGIYNEMFLNLYGIDRTPELIDMMDKFLKVKINTGGDYERIDVSEDLERKAYRVQGEVVMACADSWVTGEGESRRVGEWE